MEASRLERIIKMVTVMQSDKPLGVNELAKKMGVNKRSIYRDLKTLKTVGIPYHYNQEARGYRIEETAFLPPLALKMSEALALLMAAEQVTGAGGLPLMGPAQDAAIKIQSSLPIRFQRACGPILDSTSIRLPARARHEGLENTFETMQRGILHRRKVQVSYRSLFDDAEIAPILSPYHLHYGQRAWYVMGHSSQHDSVRTFKLARMDQAKLLTQHYLLEKPFNVQDYIGDAWSLIPEGKMYHVKVQFSKKVAKNVAEINWHRRQKLAWHNDGKLTYDVDVDGLGEIMWWVMSYGDQAKVLEPKVLKRRIIQMAERMLKQY